MRSTSRKIKTKKCPPKLYAKEGFFYYVIMYYVYIIQSQKDNSYYTGVTTNLEKRLEEHNSGSSRYSSRKKPFKIVWYCAFTKKEKAYDFEKYLKKGSGVAFRNKRLL